MFCYKYYRGAAPVLNSYIFRYSVRFRHTSFKSATFFSK